MSRVGHSDLALYRRLLRQARPYWPHIAGVLLLSLLSTPLSLLVPVPLKIVVDSVIGSQPIPDVLDMLVPASIVSSEMAILILTTVLLVAIALLTQLQVLGHSLLRTYAGEKLVLAFRAQLFDHVQRLSLSYHDSRGTADSIYRIQHDAPSIQHIAIDGVIPFITATFTLGSMLYVILLLDWRLELVALTVAPAIVLISQIFRRRLRQRSREVKKLESAALSVAQEVLTVVRVVKAFGQEDRERERFVSRSTEGMRARIVLAFQEGFFGLLVGVATAMGTAAVLYVGVHQVLAGALSVGELLLVLSYLTQLYSPLKTIGKNTASLQSRLASAERAFSLLDEPADVAEWANARPLVRASGAICFRNVSFAYENGVQVLRDVSFEISPGDRVGIAGRSGAGKTTLVSLLLRFYDPAAGQILLDGLDLRRYRLADLRNQFAIVLQEPVLFSTSIAENIAYARPDASFDAIVVAAESAGAHEFIVRLPQGYDTPVGERGMRLSGGERQRISLARAFLKDAPILILDEPTSSVDAKTEAAILAAMERLMRGRTSFTIAHRPSTLQSCNVRLLVKRGGRVDLTLARPVVSKASALAYGEEDLQGVGGDVYPELIADDLR
ncbi:MAG: ABC transporter ATP-binding protein [Chloroflexi bacterium]|nr:ABC transporter ATP-binding protein [Chloroflexota bacterium]